MKIFWGLGIGDWGLNYTKLIIKEKSKNANIYLNLTKNTFKNLRIEIEILKKMDHPNIIKLSEIFELGRSLYLIMEESRLGVILDRILENIWNK